MKKLNTFLHVKIEEHLKENARKKAEKENKGLSRYVRDLIAKDLKEEWVRWKISSGNKIKRLSAICLWQNKRGI